MVLPTLKDIIVQEDDTSFDMDRWFLLQWLLDVDENEISAIKESADSKFIRVVTLTVKFLLLVSVICHKKPIVLTN